MKWNEAQAGFWSPYVSSQHSGLRGLKDFIECLRAGGGREQGTDLYCPSPSRAGPSEGGLEINLPWWILLVLIPVFLRWDRSFRYSSLTLACSEGLKNSDLSKGKKGEKMD